MGRRKGDENGKRGPPLLKQYNAGSRSVHGSKKGRRRKGDKKFKRGHLYKNSEMPAAPMSMEVSKSMQIGRGGHLY